MLLGCSSQRILDICHVQFHTHLMSPKFSENSKDYVGFFLSGAFKKLIYRVYFRGELLHNEYRSRKGCLLCCFVYWQLFSYIITSRKLLKTLAVTTLSSKVFQYAKAISVEQKILKIRRIIDLFHWFYIEF